MLKYSLCICSLFLFPFLMIAQSLPQTNKAAIIQELKVQKLTDKDAQNFELTQEHKSEKSNIQHYYLRQTVNDIPISQAVSGFHFNTENEIIKSDHKFLYDASSKVESATAQLSVIDALESVIEKEKYKNEIPLEIIEEATGVTQIQLIDKADISLEDIPASLVYYKTENQTLKLAWDISILELDAQNWWSMKVDANNGDILEKINWVVKCNFDPVCEENVNPNDHTNHIHAAHRHSRENESFNPDSYRVFPLGIESPNHGGRTLEVDPADLIASPFGWHDTNGSAGGEFTITRGNNVHAQEDQNADNGTGASPDGGAALDFDFPIDFSQDPLTTDNENSALTNLFYWNNIMHDVWYQYGFDEASGNFQSNNYGNGGTGGDYVFADGQDGGGTNNANFSAPTEGSNPRMQMFLWSPSSNSVLDVNSPASIAGDYDMVVGSFGPSTFNVTGDLVIVDDGSGAPSEGCGTLTNGSSINGNIAVVDRGNCEFGTKCLNAQNEGAIAVIVCNNVAGASITMGPGVDGASVTIPSIMISQADCAAIRVEIPTVNVTMNVTGGGISIDGDYDNGIIAHEYGHGISIRLTGGANNSGCLSNSEQMGEGWSDWFGLMLTTNSSDIATDPRGIGTYALGQSTSGVGIRDFPYTTDMNINPFTYNDIDGVSIPHGVGSVWSTMLWDMTWELVSIYGWDDDYYYGTGGNNIAMNLVIEGLKLQPCSPGFVDGRDAILAADQVLYGGVNQCAIWAAFARRGLGANASQGSTASVTDGVESFEIPGSCNIELDKIADLTNAAPGAVITYTITATNATSSGITNVIITDEIPANTTYLTGTATDGGTESGGIMSFPGVSIGPGLTHDVSFSVMVDPSLQGGSYDFGDNVEGGNLDWETSATNAGLSEWIITTSNPNAGTSHWFAEDVASPNDQYLTLSMPVNPQTGSELKFFHFYDTEVDWDGGRVEISTDNGFTWADLGDDMTQNGYNGILDNSAASPGFTGNSGSYLETIVDLDSYAGQPIKVRFFMHCDAAVGGNGWYIDDISIDGLQVTIPNEAMVSADGGFTNTASLGNPTLVDAASCTDGIQNGDETGVDCGGSVCDPCNNCETNETYSGNIADGVYQTSNMITSDGTVVTNSNVEFYSETIQLDPNFNIEQGATFTADYNPCVPLVNEDDDEK